MAKSIDVSDLNIYYGDFLAVEGVTIPIAARSVTYRVIMGADHALSNPESGRAYDQLLSRWLSEMIFGAR